MKIVKLLALGVFSSAYAKPVDKLSWPDYVSGQFVVKLKSNASTFSTLANSGLKFKQSVNGKEGVVLVERDQAASIRMLGLDKRVSSKGLDRAIQRAMLQSNRYEYVEPNYIYKASSYTNNGYVNLVTKAKSVVAKAVDGIVPNDPMFPQLWGMQNLGQPDSEFATGVAGADIGATKAWTLGTGSKNVVVAIIDTGIDYTHPDLVDNIWSGPNPDATVGGVIHGYNAITNVYDPMDDNEHGTHCAGTIGAVGNNGVGVAGVNWNVSLMGSKFLSADGSGTLADAIKAVDFATSQNVDVMSNSWGGGGFSQALMDAIQRANEKGIVFVAAAGNSTQDNDASPSYPASYVLPNVISVAASTNTDSIASFSSFGKTTVHVAAPGQNIVSTTPHNTYSSFSGTSMATPHVSGAVALFKSMRGAHMSPEEIRNEIMNTSDRLTSLKTKVAMGGSRLNVYNLLANVQVPGPVIVPVDQWSALLPNVIETAHPYLDKTVQEWRVTQEGAKYMRLHFSQFDTESRFDTLTVKNATTGEVLATYSGKLDAFVTDQLDASDLILEFKSDLSVSKTGFVIDGYSWSNYAPAPVVAGL